MKNMSVEITKNQTIRFFVSVPDHWPRNLARTALTPSVIEEIAEKADSFDWDNGEADFKITALYETTDADVNTDDIAYAFPDEPPPPHPDQLPLIV